jgi:hypothetical protein
MRRRSLAAFAVAVATGCVLAAAAAGERASEDGTPSFDRCHDQTNFFPVEMDEARARVPASYKLAAGPDGTATLMVTMFRCDLTLGGTALRGPVAVAAAAFQLEATDGDGLVPDPSDHGSAASSGAVLLDFYPLFVVTDSQRLADWLRSGTGLDVRYASGLEYEYAMPEPVGVADFAVDAPRPTPSPFTVTGDAAAQRAAAVAVDENWWHDTMIDGKARRTKLAFPSHADYVAPANVVVDAEDGSELARLLGTADGRAQDPFAVSVRIDHFDAVKTVVTDGTASFDRCHDQGSFLSVPMANVRDRVPQHYGVRSLDGVTATLVVAIDKCEVTIGGKPLPGAVTWAAVGVEIEPPADANHDPAAVPADLYMLFMVTDSEQLADWLRAGTGLRVRHVQRIRHDFATPELPLGQADFLFDAPAPTPSPFTVTGTARTQHVTPVLADVNFWQDTKTLDGRTWRVKLAFPSHADYVAFGDMTVDAEDGSELARIIGTPDGTGQDPFALSVLIDHYDAVKTRKVVRP